ncbi:MAG: GNAT family N-acetyltransferase [Oscillospiraceae bacterium]|nr:GNAT family N-acetyltransferase [Oscillospiraceae bacterium]
MLKFEVVTDENFHQAAAVYPAAWRESHKNVCTPEFLVRRDCVGYLRRSMDGLYLIFDDGPVGVFRLNGEELSDIYVHPDRTGRGYGTACLRFAMDRNKRLRLTVLSTNERAIHLYLKMGFRFTGADTQLRDGLWEREMIYTENHNG